MSIPHAASGELIDIQPLGENPSQTISSTLVRAEHLEIFRFVLPAGISIPEHKASGAITILDFARFSRRFGLPMMNINHCNNMVVRLHEIKIDARQFMKINIFINGYFDHGIS